MVGLAGVARDVSFVSSSTPLFIWSCWVAARVLFGTPHCTSSVIPKWSNPVLLVHAFVGHQVQPDDDFDIIVSALKDQAIYWSLASESSPILTSKHGPPIHITLSLLCAVPVPAVWLGVSGLGSDAVSRTDAHFRWLRQTPRTSQAKMALRNLRIR